MDINIKWSAGVSYTDLTNKRFFTSYSINAENKQIAEDITKELFIMEYGVKDDIDIVVEPEYLSTRDMQLILSVRDTVFKQLEDSFRGKNYKAFTLAFQQFEGFSAHFRTLGESYFWFSFRGITLKAVFSTGSICYLDTEEILYTTDSGRKILVRRNWSEFYYCI